MIKGKVIQILDEFRIIIDKGSIDGVEEGLKFIIYSEGDDIIDPITYRNLGKLEIRKHKGIAIHVQDEFSIIKSNEYIQIPGLASVTSVMIGYSSNLKPFKIPDEQNITDSKSKSINLDDKTINIGDFVRSVD